MRASPHSLAPGALVGSYAIERLLGEGSMGQVYEARHVRLGRRVALKLLRAGHARDPSLVQRFFQEARAVNRVDHPNLIAVQDFVEDTDEHGQPRAWCVMELLEGGTLAELMKEKPLPLRRALGIVEQVCRGLAAAHAAGIVHRDLKPENVFVSRAADGTDLVKVLDFGVAKLLLPDPAVTLRQTHEGAVVGTPLFMSPEQAAGLPIDTRADIYGVGCLLYELVSGRSPFTANDLGTLLTLILTQPPQALGRTARSGEDIPEPLDELVRACLEKQAEARPPSMEAVAARIGELLASPSCDGARRRSRVVAARAAGAVCAAVLLASVVLVAARASASDETAADARLGSAEHVQGQAQAHVLVPPLTMGRPDAAPRELAVAHGGVGDAVGRRAVDNDGSANAIAGATAAESDAQTAGEGVVQRGRKGPARTEGGVRRTSSSVGVSRDAVLNPFRR